MLTKVFQSGNSQAVRIPLAFRFDVDTVEIIRGENGDVILRPTVNQQANDFVKFFENLDADDDFIRALEERDTSPPQERETL